MISSANVSASPRAPDSRSSRDSRTKEFRAARTRGRDNQALLAAARRHEFDVMVVEDISRLWRNRAEFGPRPAELEDLGVHCLICVGGLAPLSG
jgi:hypothetical protein